MTLHICKNCQQTWESRYKVIKSGLCSKCYRKELRCRQKERDPEAYLNKQKEYAQRSREKNPEAWRETYQKAFKKYYQKNSQEIIDKTKKYKEENAEHLKQKQKQYYENNKEYINQRSRKWQLNNLDKVSKYATDARERNRERTNKKYRERYALDPNFKLKVVLRARLNSALKGRWTEKAGSTVEDVGCSIDFLVDYITEQFSEGMSWDNYGEWEIDHIKPLSSFDLTNRKEFLEVCHYTNLQPLWKSENASKKDRDLDEWLASLEEENQHG